MALTRALGEQGEGALDRGDARVVWRRFGWRRPGGGRIAGDRAAILARHAARRSEVAAATDLAERSREGAKQVTLLESYEVRRALVRTLKVTMSLFPADHDPPGWQPPASSRTS